MKVLAGLGIALLVGVAFVAFEVVEVCEDQLSTTGDTAEKIEACRQLSVSDPPTIALGLALLALVGVFYNEVSGFGVTLKRAVQDAKKSADEANEKVVETAGELVRTEGRVTREIAQIRSDVSQRLDANLTQISQIRSDLDQKLTADITTSSTASGGTATAIGAVLQVTPGEHGLSVLTGPSREPGRPERQPPAGERTRDALARLRVQPAYADARIPTAIEITADREALPVKVAAIGGVPHERLWHIEDIGRRLTAPYVAAGAARQAIVQVASAAVGHLLAIVPEATIFPIGVVGEDGRVPSSATLQDGVMAALGWEPDIILVGVGGGPGDPAVDQLLSRASRVAFVVAGAGNLGGEGSAWPGSLPYVASVAALDSNGRTAAFSNRGVGVDLAVRGVDVLSLIGVGEHDELQTGRLSGTSLGEQLVGGIGALLVSRAGAEPSAVLQILRDTAEPTDATGDVGRVNAEAAVSAALVGR